jgi:hypothetical protein
MPKPLGDFISKEVYGGQLLSEHPIAEFSCISFIDVSKGEEEPGGHSWKVCTASWACYLPATDSVTWRSEYRRGAYYCAFGSLLLSGQELLRYHSLRRSKKRNREATKVREPTLAASFQRRQFPGLVRFTISMKYLGNCP